MFKLFNKKTEAEITVNITNRTIIRVVLIVVASVLLLAAVRQASHALILIFTAFFLALALNAPVHWIARHLPGKMRGNRTLATTVSFVAVILLLGGFIASIAPPLVRQTENFISAAPNLVQDFRSQDSTVGKFIRAHHLQSQVDNLSKQLSDRLKNSSGSAVSTVSHIGSSVFSVLTILVITFMMLIEGPSWLKFMKEVIPDNRHADADRLGSDMYKVIKGYVNGQVLLAALASLLIVPAIFALGISYPIALMVVVFVCGLIPMVGHTIGAIIVTTVALFHSPISAVIILAYYILYQQIENYVIQPRIQANSTNMSPLLVFISVVVGVEFGGLLGGLVAIPIAGCIRILVLDFLRNQHILTPEEEAAIVETR